MHKLMLSFFPYSPLFSPTGGIYKARSVAAGLFFKKGIILNDSLILNEGGYFLVRGFALDGFFNPSVSIFSTALSMEIELLSEYSLSLL